MKTRVAAAALGLLMALFVVPVAVFGLEGDAAVSPEEGVAASIPEEEAGGEGTQDEDDVPLAPPQNGEGLPEGEPEAPQDVAGADDTAPFAAPPSAEYSDSLGWTSWVEGSNVTMVSPTHVTMPQKTGLSLFGTFGLKFGSGDVGRIVVTYSPGWAQPTVNTNPGNDNVTDGDPRIQVAADGGYVVTYTANESAGNGALSLGAVLNPTSQHVYPGADFSITVQVYDRADELIDGAGGVLTAEIDADLYQDMWVGGVISRYNSTFIYSNKSEHLSNSNVRNSTSLQFSYAISDNLGAGLMEGDLRLGEDQRLRLDLEKIRAGVSGDTYQTASAIDPEWLESLSFGSAAERAGNYLYLSSGWLNNPSLYFSIAISVPEDAADSKIPDGTYLWFQDPDMYDIVDASGNVTNYLYLNGATGQQSAKVAFKPESFSTNNFGSLRIDRYTQPEGRMLVYPSEAPGNYSNMRWLADEPETLQPLFTMAVQNSFHEHSDYVEASFQLPQGVSIQLLTLPAVSASSDHFQYGSDFEVYDSDGALVGGAVVGERQKLEFAEPLEGEFTVRFRYVGRAGDYTNYNNTALTNGINFYGYVDVDPATTSLTVTSTVADNGAMPASFDGASRAYPLTTDRYFRLYTGSSTYVGATVWRGDSATGEPTNSQILNDTHVLSIGEDFYIRAVVGNLYPYYSNVSDSVLESPVAYISLPEYVVSTRGDQEFTIDDVYSLLPQGAQGAVASVRTVKNAAGEVLPGVHGGCVVEIAFNSVEPIAHYYENLTGMVYPNTRVATTSGETISYPSTEYAYLRVTLLQDSTVFNNVQQTVQMGANSVLFGTLAENVRAYSATDTKGLLGGGTGLTAEQITSEYGVGPMLPGTEGGGYGMYAASLPNFTGAWPQSGIVRMQVDNGSLRTAYNPFSGQGTYAQIEQREGNEYVLEINNLTTAPASQIAGYFVLPAHERWAPTVAASVITDPATTTAGTPIIQYAAPGREPGIDDNNPGDWVAPYEGQPYAIRIQVDGLKGGEKYVGRLAFSIPALDGATVRTGDKLVGQTQYRFGELNGVATNSLNGDAFTAAMQLVFGDAAPVITAPDASFEVGSQAYDWLEGVTAWDNDEGDLTPYVEVVSVTPLLGEGYAAFAALPAFDADSINQYQVAYQVEDSTGLVGTASRTILVWADIDLRFDARGGTTPPAQQIRFASPYGSLPATERSGYTFDGWYTEPEATQKVQATDIMLATGPQTLYAKWTVLPVTDTSTPEPDSSTPTPESSSQPVSSSESSSGRDSVVAATGDSGMGAWLLALGACGIAMLALAILRLERKRAK